MPFIYKGTSFKTLAEAEAAFEADVKAQQDVLAAREAALSASAAKPAQPLSVSVTYRGQLEVRLSDAFNGGNYPVLSVTGMQFEGLIANLDAIKAAYETAKAQNLVVRTWQEMKPSIKEKTSRPKPTAIPVGPTGA